MPEKYKKLIRYIFAGGFATLVNLVVLYLCVEYLHLYYLVSAVVAFCFGVITSYTLQKFWTFKDKDTENMQKQFTHFVTLALLMLGLNTLLVYTLVEILVVWYILAQVASSLCIAFINYNVFNRIIFKS